MQTQQECAHVCTHTILGAYAQDWQTRGPVQLHLSGFLETWYIKYCTCSGAFFVTYISITKTAQWGGAGEHMVETGVLQILL